jgi:hypothetical protein
LATAGDLSRSINEARAAGDAQRQSEANPTIGVHFREMLGRRTWTEE